MIENRLIVVFYFSLTVGGTITKQKRNKTNSRKLQQQLEGTGVVKNYNPNDRSTELIDWQLRFYCTSIPKSQRGAPRLSYVRSFM